MARRKRGPYEPREIIGHTRTFDFPREEGKPWVAIDRYGNAVSYKTRAAMRAATPGGRRAGYVRIEYQRRLATQVRVPSIERLERIIEATDYGTPADRATMRHIRASWQQALDAKDYVAAQKMREAYETAADHATGAIDTPTYARMMKPLYEWGVSHGYVIAATSSYQEWLYYGKEA